VDDRVRARVRRTLLMLTLTLVPATAARASDTQWWQSDSPADYVGAETHGIVVGPEGVLALGPAARLTRADSLGVIWSIALLPDGSVALAGDRGRIDRWTSAGGIRPWVRLAAGQVVSLAVDGTGLVAGTAPGGAIYHVSNSGDTALIARTGERYVWGLAPAGKGAWYAATGTRGRLLRVERGRTKIILDTDESNLVSLIPDGHGGVYTGGDSRGRVLHARSDGSVSTVFDAPEDEIRGLALGADGALYAAALTASAVANDTDDKDEDASPAPARSAVSGGRAVVYRIVPDSSAALWWVSPQPFVFGLATGHGTSSGLLVATGNRAGVYRVQREDGASQWLSSTQGQVTALGVGEDGRVFAATSNPGGLWQLGPGRAESGELLSGVLDARRIARFGRIRWRGTDTGGASLRTRSGNTEMPDTTWGAWTDVTGGAMGSAAARYLQWKLNLRGSDARIESIEAAWREQNLPPNVEDLVVAPQGVGFREGELLPRTDPITQSLPGGQRVEYSLPPISAPRQLRDLPTWARGLRTIQWRATDPNGDALRFRIDCRDEDGMTWRKITDDLDATTYTWDTNSLPDGRYRVRVTASDATGNAVGEERSDAATSEPFSVDNTPPAVIALEARGEAGAARIQGRAEDRASGLSRLEVAVDDATWRPITPDGGMTDSDIAMFHARLDALTAGEHSIGVRAVDRAGNTTTRTMRVTVPPAR
jgi:hypothetical protein